MSKTFENKRAKPLRGGRLLFIPQTVPEIRMRNFLECFSCNKCCQIGDYLIQITATIFEKIYIPF